MLKSALLRVLHRITADFAPLHYGAIRQVVELPRLLRVVAAHTVQGIVLGDRITAAPISALWS